MVRIKVKGNFYANENSDLPDLVRSAKEWKDIIYNSFHTEIDEDLLKRLKFKISNVSYEIDEGRPRSYADAIILGEKKDIEDFIEQFSDNGIGFYRG